MTSNAVPGREWWVEALACPNCRRPMQRLDQCLQCGTSFGSDGGTPILLAEDAIAEVTFTFPQRQSCKTDEQRALYIRYPERFEGTLDAPYHLDRAHAAVLLKLPKGSRVLELGCGGGQMRRWTEALGLRYVGVDISKTRVFEWLKSYGGPDVLCDAHFLPFQDEQFDLVYAAALTQHIACPVRYAQEARRVLRPGGYFLSNGAFLEPWHDSSHFHLSPDGAIELLLEAGFGIDAVWPGRGYHAFRSILEMAFHGPFRAVRHFGWMPMALYRLQGWLRNVRRRLRSTPPVRRIIQDCTVAGAIDWIARRPAQASGAGRNWPQS
jgi:SAM-dependent methyltransferase